MVEQQPLLMTRQLPGLHIMGAIVLSLLFVLTQITVVSRMSRGASWVLLPLVAWFSLRIARDRFQARTRRVIEGRLAHLPSDFVVLHDLVVPAPWGFTVVDYLILSRFGLVVVANGPPSGWMLERVEAVRSYLIAQGVTHPSTPVRSLVLLAPGTPDSAVAESDAPVVRVEQLRLGHLAPSPDPVLSQEQLRLVLRSFRPVT